jgi:hypothetical protein
MSGPDQPFWFDDLVCDGTEATVMDCSHLPLGEHNCSTSGETVYVSCQEPGPQNAWRLEDITVQENGDIYGRPEYLNNGEWRAVCDDTYSDEGNVATVLCRSVGLETDNATFHFSQSGPSDEFWFDDVYCAGTENDITECSHTFGSDNCSSSETVYVTCGAPEPPVWRFE